MRQDSNLSPNDGFRLEELLIPKEEILEELSRLRESSTYIDSGSGICTAKPGVFPKEARETLPVCRKGFFTKNPNTQYRKNLDRGSIWNTLVRVKTPPIYFHDTGADILLGFAKRKAFNRIMPINFRSKRGDVDDKLTHPKMQIKGNSVRNKIEATLKIKEECKYEYVRYKPIQMNMEDKKDMQMIIREHINLGLIEPGISAYSSPGFLIKMENESKKFTAFSTPQGIELQEHIVEKIRNFPDILKDKKQLQSFLGVVNFAGIFIKDLAKYRKDFRPLLKETESAKWKWEEIHTQRVRELKQVCNNLPKLAIPQDEDELVVYTDANDYRWAAVLMKRTTTGEEPCRYTGGLFTEQQAKVWHINEKEFFAVWKAFKKWPLFLLAKEFTLKVDNTNVKAFLKNKLESKN
ncbi:UNVERIFIED_CONTAM: Enzymatic polyprotein [Sesamum angustifolium]|uniref:Enzymatic polyprotein n=1 Tax=Sesamum angustifolium TaxID=2727405 RepID=A0AAW2KND1_9LAMI